MIFDYVSGIQEVDKKKMKINYREAVRAIIFQGNSILMVHTNKGDYKFPGGGVNKGESHKETLEREVKEETGYLVNNVKNRIGVFIERNIDEYEENTIFKMTSYYYKCEISDNKTLQELDDYEFELEFSPVWIPIDEAIYLNEGILKKDPNHINPWVYRETKVLKALKENNCN